MQIFLKIKHYFSNLNNFNLQRSFNLRAVEISMTYIFPFSMLHSLAFWVQNIVYISSLKESLSFTFQQGSLKTEVVHFVSFLKI